MRLFWKRGKYREILTDVEEVGNGDFQSVSNRPSDFLSDRELDLQSSITRDFFDRAGSSLYTPHRVYKYVFVLHRQTPLLQRDQQFVTTPVRVLSATVGKDQFAVDAPHA